MSNPNNFGDGAGGVLSDERMDAIRRAMATFKDLTAFERNYVTCWFCPNCGKYAGPGESTCVHEPNDNEKLAARYHAETNAAVGEPEGTRESLARTARMLEIYGPECYPANPAGQVHFVRAMMQSTVDEIKAFLANTKELAT